MENKIELEMLEILKKIKDSASFCYGCNACNVVCPTNFVQIFSPRLFIQKINATEPQNIDEFIKRESLFNCLTCEQCNIYCPMTSEKEGVQFVQLIKELRIYAYQKGLLNTQLEFNKTHDAFQQINPKIQAETAKLTNKINFLKAQSNLQIQDHGENALFLGCHATMENRFAEYGVNYTDSAISAVKILNRMKIIPVVLETKCCGHDNLWSGDQKTAASLAKFNIDLMKKAGVKRIIVECAEGYRMWKYEYPQMVDDFNFEVIHLSELLNTLNLRPLEKNNSLKLSVTYHDPCRLGRLGGKIYDPPRDLLKRINKINFVELEHNKDNANCCGISSFMGCNSNTKILRENRVKEALATGADYLITTCPKCMTHFNCYLKENEQAELNEKYDRNTPKKSIKVMDLASFLARIYQL